jgi:GTP-binding protein
VTLGKKIERMVSMTNFDQPEAVSRLQNIMRKMGVEKALERSGAQSGDPIQIGAMEFLFSPGRNQESEE